MYYIEYYDAQGFQLLGTNGLERIDGRQIDNELKRIAANIERQYSAHLKDKIYRKPREKYAKVVMLPQRNAWSYLQVVRESVTLHDLF
tara:strand:- start:327 stop:590 length:264 start_codon:yes stop_codon:yes gene_type:complete